MHLSAINVVTIVISLVSLAISLVTEMSSRRIDRATKDAQARLDRIDHPRRPVNDRRGYG